MRKSSIVQITIALAIALGYVYLFGVTGRVDGSAKEKSRYILPDVYFA